MSKIYTQDFIIHLNEDNKIVTLQSLGDKVEFLNQRPKEVDDLQASFLKYENNGFRFCSTEEHNQIMEQFPEVLKTLLLEEFGSYKSYMSSTLMVKGTDLCIISWTL